VWLQTREYLGGVLVHSESTPHASAYASWQAISTTYYTHLPGSSVDFLVMGSGSGPSNSFDIDDVRITATSIPVLAVPAAPQAALAARVFPNPMRGQGTLSFALPKAGPLAVRVLDVTGRLVRTVSDERSAAAGVHTWKLGHDGTGHRLPAGIYFYRIDSAEGRRSGRFVVLE
jgi:hypothetical protein